MTSEFDDYAGSYDSALNQGLSLSGEPKEYFAHQRVRWLAARLSDLAILGWAAGIFVFGWALQFWGHKFEGMKPAFFDDRALLYEEAPQAYKRVDRVVEDLLDRGLVEVIATLRPQLTYKRRERET